jgi:hypothetical protein
MDDPIQGICQILAEILRSEPNSEIDQIISRVQNELALNSSLAIALQSDLRMVQINQGKAKGYQVLVTGGIANVGDHFHVDTEVLGQALGKLLEEFAKQKSTGIPQNIPRSGVVKFIDRDEKKLTGLHAQLQQNDRIAITAINGMQGIGKTELALQYATKHFKQGTYPGGICWLQVRKQEIAQQILNYAQAQLGLRIPEQLDLARQISYCWRNWAAGEVLVILDDVIDYKAIESYLPPYDQRFKVLMTTHLRLGSSFKDFPVEELDEESAIDLLKSLVTDGRIQAQIEDVKVLCKRVGYLPLGLELLGRFLSRKQDWTVSRLIEELASKSLAAGALRETELGMTHKLGVAAALELSWQELGKSEQELACLLGLLTVSPIPWELVEQFLGEIDSDDLEDTRDEGLIIRNLLKRVGEGTYQLHPIVQEYFRYKILNSEELKTFQNEIAKKIGEIAKTNLTLAWTLDNFGFIPPQIYSPANCE